MHRHGLAAVLFDYRGVGESQGAMTRAGGVTDVAAVLAFCVATLGYGRERVALFGHSIGGGFGAEAARFFAPGAVVSDRSFGRLTDVAPHHVYPPAVAPGRAHETHARVARWLIHDLVAHAAAWELDAAAHWRAIADARKAVVFHAEDGVIPFAAQLGPTLAARHGVQPERWGLAAAAGSGAAADAADAANGCSGLGVLVQIAGAADDAHNRDLSAQEADAFFTRVLLPMLDVAAGARPPGTLPAFVQL
jgi:pimeloyl-ACP methyl ester carboxylesterase